MTVFADKAGIKLGRCPHEREGEIVAQLLGASQSRHGKPPTLPLLFGPGNKGHRLLAERRFESSRRSSLQRQGHDVGFGRYLSGGLCSGQNTRSGDGKLRDVINKTCQDPAFISGMKACGNKGRLLRRRGDGEKGR